MYVRAYRGRSENPSWRRLIKRVPTQKPICTCASTAGNRTGTRRARARARFCYGTLDIVTWDPCLAGDSGAEFFLNAYGTHTYTSANLSRILAIGGVYQKFIRFDGVWSFRQLFLTTTPTRTTRSNSEWVVSMLNKLVLAYLVKR